MREIQEEIEQALTPVNRKRLFAYACRLLGSMACDLHQEGIDLVSEAVCSVMTGQRKWNKSKTPEPIDYLFSVIKSLAFSRHKSESRKPSPRMSPERAEELGILETTSDNWEERIDAERFIEKVMTEIDGDKVCEAIFTMVVLEERQPAEVASLLNMPIGEIYSARKRLDRTLKDLQKQQVACPT